MFRAGLLLIIRRINSAHRATGMVIRYVDWLLPAASQQNRVDPPDDEQQACSKHVEAYY